MRAGIYFCLSFTESFIEWQAIQLNGPLYWCTAAALLSWVKIYVHIYIDAFATLWWSDVCLQKLTIHHIVHKHNIIWTCACEHIMKIIIIVVLVNRKMFTDCVMRWEQNDANQAQANAPNNTTLQHQLTIFNSVILCAEYYYSLRIQCFMLLISDLFDVKYNNNSEYNYKAKQKH
jgi:hypothetical protein